MLFLLNFNLLGKLEFLGLLLVLDLADELVDVAALLTDLFEHLQHGLVGAAVQRTPQRIDAAGDGGEQVGP